MVGFFPLKNIKKRDWAVAAALAFVLSLAVYLFDNRGFSAAAQPAFRQMAVCCAVFCCAVGLTFTQPKPWIPLAVTFAGTAVAVAAEPEVRTLLLFVFLPAALLCWLLWFFPPHRAEGARRLPLWGGACALLLGCDVYLAVRVAGIAYLRDYFVPSGNDRLWGFFVLLAMLLASVLLCFVVLPRSLPAKDGNAKTGGGKKKNGKARAGKKSADSGISVQLLFVPLLLFFVGAVFCSVILWERGDKTIPYSLLSALSFLFVLLALCAEKNK